MHYSKAAAARDFDQYENRQHYQAKKQIPVTTQIIKPPVELYESGNLPSSRGSTRNINKYSYNTRDRESSGGSRQKEEWTARYERVNAVSNNIGTVMTHDMNIENKRTSMTQMESNHHHYPIASYPQLDVNYTRHRVKNNVNTNTVTLKSNIITVRPLNTIDSVEEFVDEIPVQPKARMMPAKHKMIDRKTKSFKDTQDEENEAQRALAAKNAKRSTSVQMAKEEAERKRLFKNQNAIGNQDGSSSSSESEEEYEESVDIFTNKKLPSASKGPAIAEDDEPDYEETSAVKIFPSEFAAPPSTSRHSSSNLTNDQKSLRLLNDMFNLLKQKSNTIDFIMRKAPPGANVQTRIRRTKRKFVTQYTMFLETPDGTEIALMQTKRKRASTRIYICINALELVDKQSDENQEFERYLQLPVGKLKSKNKLKVIYDKFILTNSGKKKPKIFMKTPNFFRKNKKIQIDDTPSTATNDEAYREFLAIDYENSLFKLSQPLRFSVSMIPNSNSKNKFLEFDSKLVTKGPKFDKEKQKYVLDFNKRVKIASVNNFQVISSNPDHDENIILQVGKANNNEYICDFAFPLSAFEAFGIVLSVFNRKLV